MMEKIELYQVLDGCAIRDDVGESWLYMADSQGLVQ